jgi:hypothetical protein
MAEQQTPDTGPALVSLAQQFTGLPMNNLIGGPLMAAAQANNQMSITQTQMLRAMGFSTGKDKQGNEVYEPIMLNMTMARNAVTEDASKMPPV